MLRWWLGYFCISEDCLIDCRLLKVTLSSLEFICRVEVDRLITCISEYVSTVCGRAYIEGHVIIG